ncbi:hypothetical protein MP228_004899 [Amoeboaphelidium protococcarum]|nr:hypothetical protein MP228_004899 [Amoeboaphelidium protococcarum]
MSLTSQGHLENVSSAISWFNQQILPQLETFSLKVVKDQFYTLFLGKYWYPEAFEQLMGVRFRQKETVRSFWQRFSAGLNQLEINSNEVSSEGDMFKMVFYFKLPPSVQRLVTQDNLNKMPTIFKLVEKVLEYNGIPPDVPPIKLSCPGCEKWLTCSSCNHSRKPESKPEKKELSTKCSMHPNGNHTTEECRSQKRPRSDAAPGPKEQKTEDAKSTSTFTSTSSKSCFHCKQPWFSGHKCPEVNVLEIDVDCANYPEPYDYEAFPDGEALMAAVEDEYPQQEDDE